MSNERSKSSITLANVFAVVGLMLLAVAFFLGYLFQNDNYGLAALKAGGWTAGFALLLWLLIKAKTANAYKKGWRIAEVFFLLLYLAAAALTVPVAGRFFGIYAKAGELKTAANDDVESLNDAIAEFQSHEGQQLANTVEGLKRLLSLNDSSDIAYDLQEFISEQIEGVASFSDLTTSKLSAFEDQWQRKIERITDADRHNHAAAWKEQIEACDERVQTWNVLEMPQAIDALQKLTNEVESTLQETAGQMPFPSINREDDGSWAIAAQHNAYTPDLDANVSSVMATIKPWSLVPIIACVVIHLLILFNYFMVFRSRIIRPKKNVDTSEEGGVLLKMEE